MKQSLLFTKTNKSIPKDEPSKNARLLMQAGFIYKEMSGVYALLPLGLKVINKIENIIRKKMDQIGGQEISMTSLQRKEIWEKTNRWSDEKVDVWFKSVLKDKSEVGLGWSHEEPISEMMRKYISSYKDLPIYVYQFQNKLRNELRAKSGILRGREFRMKDMYSFSIDQKEHDLFYNNAIKAYLEIFEEVGLKDHTFLTFASGGAFTEFSHEFQTISNVGEDTIFLDRKRKIAVNKEVYNDITIKNLGLNKKELEEVSAIEVGNIFDFGTIKSEQLNLSFSDSKNQKKFVHLGSYGIGITRLMGTLVEKFSEDQSILWPENISPFTYHLLDITDSKIEEKTAEDVYKNLNLKGFDILFDDRKDISVGSKFAESDLIGCPYRLVVSNKLIENGQIEIKDRWKNKTIIVKIKDIEKVLNSK